KIPCPFLEEESCSIHLDRPVQCREYLVTSPPEYCAHPTAETVDRIRIPLRVLNGVARLDEVGPPGPRPPWVPLVVAPEWADAHADDTPARPGPELLRELLTRWHAQER